MEKYVIKHNLPPEDMEERKEYNSKEQAKTSFLDIYNGFSCYLNCKLFLRDTDKKPLRGQIQVEIDYFYYYVELYEKEVEL